MVNNWSFKGSQSWFNGGPSWLPHTQLLQYVSSFRHLKPLDVPGKVPAQTVGSSIQMGVASTVPGTVAPRPRTVSERPEERATASMASNVPAATLPLHSHQLGNHAEVWLKFQRCLKPGILPLLRWLAVSGLFYFRPYSYMGMITHDICGMDFNHQPDIVGLQLWIVSWSTYDTGMFLFPVLWWFRFS